MKRARTFGALPILGRETGSSFLPSSPPLLASPGLWSHGLGIKNMAILSASFRNGADYQAPFCEGCNCPYVNTPESGGHLSRTVVAEMVKDGAYKTANPISRKRRVCACVSIGHRFDCTPGSAAPASVKAALPSRVENLITRTHIWQPLYTKVRVVRVTPGAHVLLRNSIPLTSQRNLCVPVSRKLSGQMKNS